MTPAEILKAKIEPAAAALKAKIAAETARKAEEERRAREEQRRLARIEADKIFAEAKAYMERELKLSYEPRMNVSELVAEVLAEIAEPEGFVVEALYPEWGFCGVRVSIP